MDEEQALECPLPGTVGVAEGAEHVPAEDERPRLTGTDRAYCVHLRAFAVLRVRGKGPDDPTHSRHHEAHGKGSILSPSPPVISARRGRSADHGHGLEGIPDDAKAMLAVVFLICAILAMILWRREGDAARSRKRRIRS